MGTKTEREYRSPAYKLIQFFRRSRDGWKRKAQQSQRRSKKANDRLKQVRARRDYWKELAQAPSSAGPRAARKNAPRGAAARQAVGH